jgi:hypothetical protein
MTVAPKLESKVIVQSAVGALDIIDVSFANS